MLNYLSFPFHFHWICFIAIASYSVIAKLIECVKKFARIKISSYIFRCDVQQGAVHQKYIYINFIYDSFERDKSLSFFCFHILRILNREESSRTIFRIFLKTFPNLPCSLNFKFIIVSFMKGLLLFIYNTE